MSLGTGGGMWYRMRHHRRRPRRRCWRNDVRTAIGWAEVGIPIYTLDRRFWQYRRRFHHVIPRAGPAVHCIGLGDMYQILSRRTARMICLYLRDGKDADIELWIFYTFGVKIMICANHQKRTLSYIPYYTLNLTHA